MTFLAAHSSRAVRPAAETAALHWFIVVGWIHRKRKRILCISVLFMLVSCLGFLSIMLVCNMTSFTVECLLVAYLACWMGVWGGLEGGWVGGSPS